MTQRGLALAALTLLVAGSSGERATLWSSLFETPPGAPSLEEGLAVGLPSKTLANTSMGEHLNVSARGGAARGDRAPCSESSFSGPFWPLRPPLRSSASPRLTYATATSPPQGKSTGHAEGSDKAPWSSFLLSRWLGTDGGGAGGGDAAGGESGASSLVSQNRWAARGIASQERLLPRPVGALIRPVQPSKPYTPESLKQQITGTFVFLYGIEQGLRQQGWKVTFHFFMVLPLITLACCLMYPELVYEETTY